MNGPVQHSPVANKKNVPKPIDLSKTEGVATLKSGLDQGGGIFSRKSRIIASQANYSEKILEIIFAELRQGDRDYVTFKDMLNALSAYRIDLNKGR